MLRQLDYINSITDALAILGRKIEMQSSLNLTDLNLIAEDFYCTLLNLILGTELTNLNSQQQNAKAIDLGCNRTKLCVQVTSTSDLKKTRKTVSSFVSSKNHLKYKRLVILNLDRKKKHNVKTVSEGSEYTLDTHKDIWDYKDLIKKIPSGNLALWKEITSHLHDSLKINTEDSDSKEVKTVLALVEMLSDDDHPQAGRGFLEEPDPENKLFKRFSDHSEYLKKEYKENFSMYGNVFKDVMDSSDIGTVKIKKVGNYLRSQSDQVLTNNNGNPIVSINELKEIYMYKLAGLGVDYDEMAVKFFLIEQLIRCNVFPNTEKISHE